MGTMRVFRSCTCRAASVQRNAFERARSATRARNRVGLGVSVALEKTAQVSSIACLTVWSSIHFFFIRALCSTVLLSFLLLAQFALQDFSRGRQGQRCAELDEAGGAIVGHVVFCPCDSLGFPYFRPFLLVPGRLSRALLPPVLGIK